MRMIVIYMMRALLLWKLRMKNIITLVLLAINVNCYAESPLTNEQKLGERLFSDHNLSLNSA